MRKLLHCMASALLLFCAKTMTSPVVAGMDDSYRYRLQEGRSRKVCLHMERVYNRYFGRPWDFRDLPTKNPPFPRFPGVEYDERKALALSFSAFPSSPEFDAIAWHEGRIVRGPTNERTRPMLVADVDIDNDGKLDIVVKTSFMQGYSPGHRSASGGEDSLFLFDKGQFDPAQTVTTNTFYGPKGQKRPALIVNVTLGMSARSIRPFIYDGITYLSVYEQIVTHKERWSTLETMWVLRYQAGGWNRGDEWEPVQAERVCRFRMSVV